MLRSIAPHRTVRTRIALTAAVAIALLLAFAMTHDPGERAGIGSSAVERSAGDAKSRADGFGFRADEAVRTDASIGSAESAPPAGAGDAGGTAATSGDAAVASPLAAPELDAKIVRTANIALEVKRNRFEAAWGDAQAVANASGGYVVSASRSGADDSARTGTITMRVPSPRFESAIERLRELDGAKVEQLDVTSQDVTQEFVDTRSRLRHDRAVEARLLALLAQTDGVGEVLAVQARLDAVQEQVEVARGRLQYLEKLTSMSTISVTIGAPAAGNSHDDTDPGVLREAFDDARERFGENVAGAIVWTGGALPTIVFLTVVFLVARIAWRRLGRRAGATGMRGEKSM